MKLEAERCAEEAALRSAIRLNRVKEEEEEEEDVVAGRGVEGEVSEARCQGRGGRTPWAEIIDSEFSHGQ
jgi:hypothetical protein